MNNKERASKIADIFFKAHGSVFKALSFRIGEALDEARTEALREAAEIVNDTTESGEFYSKKILGLIRPEEK